MQEERTGYSPFYGHETGPGPQTVQSPRASSRKNELAKKQNLD